MCKFLPSKKINTNKNVIISLRTESSKVEKIDEIACKIDVSRNNLIDQCIDYSLGYLDFDAIKNKCNK